MTLSYQCREAGCHLKTGRRLARARARTGEGARTGPGISPEDIADHNSRVVLALLRSLGPLTRQELSGHLSLTEPAISGIIRRLVEAGFLEEGKRDVGARYKAAEFAIRPASAHALGLWLCPDRGALVIADLLGHVLEEQTFATADMSAAVKLALSRGGPNLCGAGIACHPGVEPDRDMLAAMLPGRPLFYAKDTEAAVAAERMLGIGEPEGGFVVILLDETVRAGLMTGGAFFRGVHGRAGDIGAMRPGREERSLNEVASAASLRRHLEAFGQGGLDDWMRKAASRLLDAVVAIAGFVSPGAVLIGGDLPDEVLDRVIGMMIADREKKRSYFVAASWIPPIRRLSFSRCGVARGAAMLPFMELLLPKPH
jgi:predicted NBD/HSP70 family sugar kinase